VGGTVGEGHGVKVKMGAGVVAAADSRIPVGGVSESGSPDEGLQAARRRARVRKIDGLRIIFL
jgi:hypothetical protein